LKKIYLIRQKIISVCTIAQNAWSDIAIQSDSLS